MCCRVVLSGDLLLRWAKENFQTFSWTFSGASLKCTYGIPWFQIMTFSLHPPPEAAENKAPLNSLQNPFELEKLRHATVVGREHCNCDYADESGRAAPAAKDRTAAEPP